MTAARWPFGQLGFHQPLILTSWLAEGGLYLRDQEATRSWNSDQGCEWWGQEYRDPPLGLPAACLMEKGSALVPSLLGWLTLLVGEGDVNTNRNRDPQRLPLPDLRGCPHCTMAPIRHAEPKVSSRIPEARSALTFSHSPSPAVNTAGHTFPLKQDSLAPLT